MRRNLAKQKLEADQCVLGAALQIDSPWLVEMLGLVGFDYVMLDNEHGYVSSNLPAMILAADAAGIVPIVRVPSHDRGFVLPALEAGAGGVQVPMVNTVAQAERLVHEVKYAPLGKRGFSGAARAAQFGGRTSEEHAEISNRETLLWVQLETREGIENAAAIAVTPGVDGVFVGPADLAQSLGMVPPRGNPTDPRLIQIMEETFVALRGKVQLGTSVFSGAQARHWQSLGVRFFLTGTAAALRSTLEQVRANVASGWETEGPASDMNVRSAARLTR
jgi:4-hydroxy-2-oxoheptanedioate aldolase